MNATTPPLSDIVAQIRAAPRSGKRRLVALAGAPASGKSTLADALSDALRATGCAAMVVPMDGFHLHNQILIDRGLLDRKGAPETFDAAGFVHLIERLHTEEEVFFPLFDRARDIAIAGAGLVDRTCDTVIVEGNYLLFDAPVWRDLQQHWDLSFRLDVPIDVLKARLEARWLAHGLSQSQAEARAAQNDLANAKLVAQAALTADGIIST